MKWANTLKKYSKNFTEAKRSFSQQSQLVHGHSWVPEHSHSEGSLSYKEPAQVSQFCASVNLKNADKWICYWIRTQEKYRRFYFLQYFKHFVPFFLPLHPSLPEIEFITLLIKFKISFYLPHQIHGFKKVLANCILANSCLKKNNVKTGHIFPFEDIYFI